MRTIGFLISLIIISQVFASLDISNVNDKQLQALVTNNWYALLPQKVITERINLLNLLSPGAGVTTNVTHLGAIRRLRATHQ